LAHGNRGRHPANMTEADIREQIIGLAKTKYLGFNQQHFTEKLKEKESIFISRSSVRRILLGQGITSPCKRKAPRHRSRRERYPQKGMMLQTDGSPHDWLEGRGPTLCLIGAIDDATNEVPCARFEDSETTRGYMGMLQEIVLSHGIPLALYHDKHGVFEVTGERLPSLEEQLAGKEPITQMGRLLEELDINSIPADSPEAKGRIERLWKTFQDRLVSELRLAGVCTKAEANQVLSQFLPEYNQKFTVPAREAGSAYRQLQIGFRPEEYFCFKYPRTVGADNVVRFAQHRLQILSSPLRQSYARCRVFVHQGLDGGLAVYYERQPLKIQPAPVEATALRKQNPAPVLSASPKLPSRTPGESPWRRWVYR
jgi:hypothetical protein